MCVAPVEQDPCPAVLPFAQDTNHKMHRPISWTWASMDRENVQMHLWHRHHRWWDYPLRIEQWTTKTLDDPDTTHRHWSWSALLALLVENHHNISGTFVCHWPWFDAANGNAWECILWEAWLVTQTSPELSSDPTALACSCAKDPK